MSSLTLPVVAIGSSAGGLQALELFFGSMPGKPGLACIVLTHLAPDRDSHLPEIIARYTDLAVASASDGVELEPDHVYILPPGHSMGIRDGRLTLKPHPGPERLHHPIDHFFAELAQDQAENAVGVVLSGTGNDGTLGLRAIKGAGGLTLAQGGNNAGPAYDSMPHNAVVAGGVDLVLAADQMAPRIIEVLRSPPRPPEVDTAFLTPGQLAALHGLLRQSSGHDFSGYKAKTFARRLARRMQIVQLTSPADYLALLRHSDTERHNLFVALLVSVTGFFRDPQAFAALEAGLPALMEAKGPQEEIRVWVPGCATGEEVYSLAMLLREHLDRTEPGRPVRIFATDINEAALRIARNGIYAAALVEQISKARLERFFTVADANFKVVKAVRDMCVFSSHSVIRDPPFSRMDLVSCRNLLIYMNAGMQDQLIPAFHFALRPGGYLFLGTSENISRHRDLFAPVDNTQRLFVRRNHGRTRRPPSRPPLETRSTHVARSGGSAARIEELGLRRITELRMLERHTPAHVVVNREGQVLHYSAKTGRYLEAPSGTPSRELLALVRPSLRFELRAAFAEALEGKLPVLREKVELEREDGLQPIDLVIEKLPDNEADPLYLVVFREHGPTVTRSQAQSATANSSEEVVRLQHELDEARGRLQILTAEYETSLEEVKSSNEELLSLNEELQSTIEEHETSKEELQSVNEELNSVNAELHDSIQELDRANADLRNLFDSTQIAIVFLDKSLRILSFTPAIRTVFNLLPGDCGRPLLDIAASIPLDPLRRDLAEVLRSGEAQEANVGSLDGSVHYLVQVQPYLDSQAAFVGITATFIDVTPLVEFEAHQKTLIEELNHRVKNMLTVVIVLAKQTVRGHSEPETFRRAFIPRIEALAKTYQLVSRERWTTVSLEELIQDCVAALCPVPDCVTTDGSPVLATPKAALALGLVFAELATNALKHGSLGSRDGMVEVTWRLHNVKERAWLVLLWRERHGPPIRPPEQESFGSTLIRRSVKHELGGQAAMRYARDGLLALFKLPFEPRLFSHGRQGQP